MGESLKYFTSHLMAQPGEAIEVYASPDLGWVPARIMGAEIVNDNILYAVEFDAGSGVYGARHVRKTKHGYKVMDEGEYILFSCGMRSYHKMDIKEKYCASCDLFCED